MKYLDMAGIQDVSEATNGSEALLMLALTEFDLVLMDWNMPELNGLETVKTIRERGLTMPVIMVTTEGGKSQVIQALRAGATNYMIKPFTADVFVTKLWKTLDIETPSCASAQN